MKMVIHKTWNSIVEYGTFLSVIIYGTFIPEFDA